MNGESEFGGESAAGAFALAFGDKTVAAPARCSLAIPVNHSENHFSRTGTQLGVTGTRKESQVKLGDLQQPSIAGLCRDRENHE
jgi:hypothetical protein